MGASKIIKQIMQERDISTGDLAKLLDMPQQTLSNRLYRDTWTFSDVQKIASILNCDVRIVTKDTNKEFY